MNKQSQIAWHHNWQKANMAQRESRKLFLATGLAPGPTKADATPGKHTCT